MARQTTILLTGASGFVGQHVLQRLLLSAEDAAAADHRLRIFALAHNSQPQLAKALLVEQAHQQSVCTVVQLDLCDTNAVTEWFTTMARGVTTTFDCCIHTAAMSSPKKCAEDPALAKAINVPQHFLSALHKHSPDCHVVVLSTDQVYDGTKELGSFYREDTDTTVSPCNMYGSTKVELEESILQKFSSPTILRSSIVLGPPAPYVEAHSTFLDFCASRVGQSTTFWTNEVRNVISIVDVCEILHQLVKCSSSSTEKRPTGVFHMGGPTAVSRHDMAVAVLEYLNSDTSFAVAAVKDSDDASGSPLNIAMDSSKLRAALPNLPPFQTFPAMVEHTLKGKRNK